MKMAVSERGIDEYDVPLAKANEGGYYDLSGFYGTVKDWYDGYRDYSGALWPFRNYLFYLLNISSYVVRYFKVY